MGINSMTGFGSKEIEAGRIGKISVELKSSNHKFLEIVLHLPEGFLALEDKLRKEIEFRIRRGRLVCMVNIIGSQAAKIFINQKLLKNYLAATKNIQKQYGINDSPKIDTLINLPGVLSSVGSDIAKEKLWPHLKKLVNQALDSLLKAKQKEGAALAVHLKKEALIIESGLAIIKARFKKVINEKMGKIKIDEERAAFLKNTDITEELERLAFHVKNFMQKLPKGSPVGKELDFIAQEMQREANTIGAKSCDTLISGRVVQLKSLIEKVREQAQNVE